MPIGFFLDKTHQPGEDEIRTALGACFPLWSRLTQFLADQYQLPGDLSYGGKNYGWNLWYRRSGKSLATLYPQAGSFVAQVVLGKDLVEKAVGLNLGENVREVFQETPQLHDGRWLFITINSDRDVEDVEKLLLLKKKPFRKK